MSREQYWVTLRYDGTDLGAGFFVTSKWILTAAHCLKGLPEKATTLDAMSSSIGLTRVRIVERDSKVDLALLERESTAPTGSWESGSPLGLPSADRCFAGDSWESPYRPSASEPMLSGDVTHHGHEYQCEGGNLIKALQLRTKTELGDYSGYSGSPVENPRSAEQSTLVGILLEQYPDRAAPDRASNVLFAGTIGDALGTFPQFDVGHLVKVLSDDESQAPDSEAAAEAGTADSVVSHGDAKLDFLDRCARRGFLDAEELRVMRLKVISSVIDTRLS